MKCNKKNLSKKIEKSAQKVINLGDKTNFSSIFKHISFLNLKKKNIPLVETSKLVCGQTL